MGGYPCQGDTPPWVPPIGPGGGGYPCWGVPLLGVPHLGYPHQTWLGGTPVRGYPTPSNPPQLDLAGGYPTSGGVLDTPRSVCLLRSRRRIFLFCLNSLLSKTYSTLTVSYKYWPIIITSFFGLSILNTLRSSGEPSYVKILLKSST